MLTRLAAVGVTACAILLTAFPGVSVEAQSPPAPGTPSTLKLPMPAGTVWRPIQGYHGGTHVTGPEQYALDLVREGGPTGGTAVIASGPGSVWFAHAPGAGNGCISIKFDGGGGLIVQMCHVVLHRPMRADERVEQGTPLGVIGENGRVGNNGLAHLHLSMHRTSDYGVTRAPYPFVTGLGISLEGRELPTNGTANQYACPGPTCIGTFTSTNGSPTPAGPTPAGGAPTASPPRATPGATSTPAGRPTPTPSTAPVIPTPPPGPRPLAIGVRAVVAGAGAGDCVNVREGPGMSATVRQCLPDGARLRLTDGPVVADGKQWWKLEGLGWAVSDYLAGLPPTLEVGETATVAAGRGDCLNVHGGPGKTAPILGCIADATTVLIAGGPIAADGVLWWQVAGLGWVVGDFLTPHE